MKLYDRLIIFEARILILMLRIEEKELIQKAEDRALLRRIFGSKAL